MAWGVRSLFAAARRRWRRVLLTLAAGLLMSLIALGCAATCRPAWYQPASIDYARLRADKRDLVGLLDEIGAALNRGRPIEVELGEAQLNRWITARREMWPDLEEPALTPLRCPQVAFLSGNRLRLAARVRWGRWRAVVSTVCRIELERDQLAIVCESVRVGKLPVPRRLVAGLFARPLAARHATRLGGAAAAVAFRNDWIWPNGKPRFRIRRLELTEGRAAVTLEPSAGNR